MKDLSEDIIEILQDYNFVFEDEQIPCTMKLNDLFQSEIKLIPGNKDAIIEKQAEIIKTLDDEIKLVTNCLDDFDFESYGYNALAISQKITKLESELSALQSGAERTTLRDELKAFNSWMCGKKYDGQIPLIDTCIDEYLNSRKSK